MKPATPREYLDEALKLSLKALELDPDNNLAYVTLGMAYLKAGKPADAVTRLERALEIHPADGKGAEELSLSLGEAYCHTGQPEKAQELFQKAVREKEPSPTAWLLTAYCLLNQGNLEAAAKAFLKTAELDHRLANARSVYAGVCALLGRYETGTEAFRQNAAKNGANVFDLCGAAACLLATGSDEKALAALEEAALLPPEKSSLLDPSLAGTAASDGLFSGLRDFYMRAALAKDKSRLRNCRHGADLLILRAAGRIIGKTTGKDFPLSAPHRLPGYLKCAIYWKMGLHDKTIECCQNILEEDSGNPLAAHLLLRSNEALGTPNKAIGFYKNVLARNNRDIGAALRVVDMYLELEDIDLALVYCRKALDIEPENLQANYNMGLILLRKDRAYAALPYLQKAAGLDPGNAATLLALGEAHARSRNHRAARSAWEKVAANDTHGEWGRQARERLAALGSKADEVPPQETEPPQIIQKPQAAGSKHAPGKPGRKPDAKDGAPEQGGS